MNVHYELVIRMIPVKQINILNPRERGKKKFAQIVANIAKLGLKKPVIVAVAESKNGDTRYNLVCGQGRLQAYVELGQELIPAIIVEGSKEDLMLMSLAENLARVFVRLRQEFDQADKQKDFNCLKVYLTGEDGTPSYQEAAAELEMTEGAVKVAVHRLRRRYRDLVREEIAQTVAGPEDVDEELRHLFAALRSPGS
jgi:ParB-like chromosome segregation protein Spo0J